MILPSYCSSIGCLFLVGAFSLAKMPDFYHTMILPILLYGCELWGFENVEQIEVFHRKYLRNTLQVRISTPNAMVYGELGRYELRYMIWQRMANFWKSIERGKGNYSNMIYGAVVENNLDNIWLDKKPSN